MPRKASALHPPHKFVQSYPLVGDKCTHPNPCPLIGQISLGVTWLRTSRFYALCNTTQSTRLSIDNMIDEQEIAGASNRTEDAPSLEASRRPERAKKATQKWTESQLQKSPLKAHSKALRSRNR